MKNRNTLPGTTCTKIRSLKMGDPGHKPVKLLILLKFKKSLLKWGWEIDRIWFSDLFSQLNATDCFNSPLYSPQNENLNLLLWIKFFNLFLYSSLNLLLRTKIYLAWAWGPVIIVWTVHIGCGLAHISYG